MDTTRSVGPIDQPDVEVYSPAKGGWEPATSFVFLTSKGLATVKANGWAVYYTFRWRRTPTRTL
jgi:hypothetical protein